MRSRTKLFRILTCVVLLAATFSLVFVNNDTYAAEQITARKLTLIANGTNGGSQADVDANHKFDFTLPTTGDVGSIQFLYCTTAAGTCTKPTDLVTTTATLFSQSGAEGFTMVNTTDGAPYITRTAASAGGAVSYQLNTVHNPSDENKTFYVRISTYASTDATGTAIDAGTVAASTATQIVLTGTMPESLIFCAGGTVSADCVTTTSGAISFNQLFSPTDTATASSQMAASTNATNGYTISVNGSTLMSGANSIAAMTEAAGGTRGSGQFGMNLKLNTDATSDPVVGAEVTPYFGVHDGHTYQGQASAGYNTVDSFKFVTGETVASSATGTDAQAFTASYIVNVPGSQIAGVYTTTLTYICTATF